MLKSITRSNYDHHDTDIMKISKKLQMRQEENNTSSGYSSRGDSVCELHINPPKQSSSSTTTTVGSSATSFSNTAINTTSNSNVLTPRSSAHKEGGGGGGTGANIGRSSSNTSPQLSDSGGTFNSGGSTVLAKLPNVKNVNNIATAATPATTTTLHQNNPYIPIGTDESTTATMLTTNTINNNNNNNSNDRHIRCISPSYSCCQKNEMLMRLNEELLQQKRDLEERNRSLSEEIQVSRRFYQGTLADLTAQLSLAENRIKYLKEVVSTQEEALHSNGKGVLPNAINQQDDVQHFTQPPSISGVLKTSKSLPTSPRGAYLESARSVTSSAGSTTSEMSSRSRLNVKNFAKMKEQLLEKNQNLKTDIELLKFKSEVPRSASVPALNIRSSQEFPAIKANNKRAEWTSSSQSMETHCDAASMEQQRRPDSSRCIVPQMTQEVRADQKKKVKNRLK